MGDELMPKIPDDFREVSDTEDREIREQAFRLALLEERVKRFQSEVAAAQLNLQKTLAEYNLTADQAKKLNEKLCISKNEDMILQNGKYYVRKVKDNTPKES